jgi:hypothetical protein
MKQKSGLGKAPAEQVLKDIRRQTRRHYSVEEKIRIVLEGLRGEENISELCRREASPPQCTTAGPRSSSRPVSAALRATRIRRSKNQQRPRVGSGLSLPKVSGSPWGKCYPCCSVRNLCVAAESTCRSRKRPRQPGVNLQVGGPGDVTAAGAVSTHGQDQSPLMGTSRRPVVNEHAADPYPLGLACP